jgi:hypothetical protein
VKVNWIVLAALSIGTLEAQSHITVLLNNMARIPKPTISTAKATAAFIFGKAGITVEWVDCESPTEQTQHPCIETIDPAQFTVVIREDRGPAQVHDSALGYATPLAGMGNHAAVLYTPIAKAVHGSFTGIDCGELLGAAVAHELGHLIMGSIRHGPGVMKGNWQRSDFLAIAQGYLSFTPEEIRELHQGIASRQSVSAAALTPPHRQQ